jgi:hypothetical protein
MASNKCVWDVSQWNRDLAPLAPLIRDSTATPQFMGSLHPRLKYPVGRRLAAGLVATAYGGSNTVTGPTLSGCTYNDAGHTITVHLNKTLLKNDVVTITRTQTPIPSYAPTPPPVHHVPPPPAPDRPGPVQDSLLMHVCTGDAADCSCLSWIGVAGSSSSSSSSSLSTSARGAPKGPPFVCEIPSNGGPPLPPQMTRGDIWTEVPVTLVDGATLQVCTIEQPCTLLYNSLPWLSLLSSL